MLAMMSAMLLMAAPAQTGTHPPTTVGAPVASSPEHLALADQLMVAMKVREMHLQMLPRVVEMLTPMMVKGNEAHADEIRTILTEEMSAALSRTLPEMTRLTRDAYARHFSDRELADMIQFFRTPTGGKMAELAPQTSAEIMAAGQELGHKAAIEQLPHLIKRLEKLGFKPPIA